MEDDHPRRLWEKLDKLQQAAVAETVHAPDAYFHADRFIAKYGQSPDWGATDRYGYRRSSPSLLGLFFYDSVMPDDLKRRLKAFVPEPEPDFLPAFQNFIVVHSIGNPDDYVCVDRESDHGD